MFGLDEDAGPCPEGAQVCHWVDELTGNQRLAQVADLLIGKPTMILTIVLIGLFARWLLHRLIDRIVRRAELGMVPDKLTRAAVSTSARLSRSAEPTAVDLAGAARRAQRARTMGGLLKSIVSGVLAAVVITMALSELEYNVAPILASAGIVGIAIGFGAQALVKDFLSGIAMLIEDQYGVGDVVDLGDATGTVEAVSLRVTRLRDVNGTVWYVRNGEIMRVGNMSQNWARAVLDVSVGYQEDLARAQQVLHEVAVEMWEDEAYRGLIIAEPEVWGVQEMAADGVLIRVALKTAPMEQWAVARELRARIKARFDREGIEIPFPQRVVWHRDEPAGTSDSGKRSGRDEETAAPDPE